MPVNPTDEAIKQLNLRYKLSVETAESYREAGFTVVWQDVIVGKVLKEVRANIRWSSLYVIILCPIRKQWSNEKYYVKTQVMG